MRPALLNPLFADLTALPGVGPKIAALIAKAAGGPRLVDLVLTPPHGIIDRSYRPTISEAKVGDIATLEVTIDRHDPPPVKARPYRVICSDETGFITLVYFHPRKDYLQKLLPEGARRIISGRVDDFSGARQMLHPDHVADPDKPDDLALFEPIYPLTAGLGPAVMAKAMRAALARVPTLPEWQDEDWRARQQWPSFNEALNALHKPQSAADASLHTQARARLAYDELLANQAALALIRHARTASAGRRSRIATDLRKTARAALPFALTGAQERVLADIDRDMAQEKRMVRLVQGDVGSGKTLVAFFAMLNAVESGAQAALMAPTEILARQHAASLADIAAATGVTIETLTGRDKGREREAKLTGIARGYVHIVIGTHALFQKTVAFHNLALVVVDEQHRFGVHQRLALSAKGPAPDTLVMTATPIPRTLALTAYGDMDASAIDEKPPGRKPIKTSAIPTARLDDIVSGLARTIARGEQAYWVCPLVAESDLIDLTSAEERADALRAVLGDRVGLVHGKMTGPEKDAAMAAFHRGELSVLVATTVIEVGVDAPNATVIVIEHAERFGLAQLHQLRGRVGRGDRQGHCILFYKAPLGTVAKARLQIMRESDDGFRIAEEDLRLRGPGDFLGAAQSGLPVFNLADASAHQSLLKAANDDARLIVERDPRLESPRGAALRVLLYLFQRDDAVRLIRSG